MNDSQSSKNPESKLKFACGKSMKNRFMLAPMTNKQSHEDGTLSDDEYHWLMKRAEGEFGMVMTCAAQIQDNGKSWKGQLAISDDKHIPGHLRLTQGIQSYGSLAVIQLHHGGMRAPEEIIGDTPVCPSDHREPDAIAMSLPEVKEARDNFIQAAIRAQKAGYDGVEVHGAHGYLLTQFLSKDINKREDEYGGSLEHRSRIIFEIVDGIREKCGSEFLLGVRLSTERFGMELSEMKMLCQQLIDRGQIDFLDISLWDVFKDSEEEGLSLMAYFSNLNRKAVKLTVAGKISGGEEVNKVMENGYDFVAIGKSAILHHDFPRKVIAEPTFRPVNPPVSAAYLEKEGLSPTFIEYMSKWKGFVKE